MKPLNIGIKTGFWVTDRFKPVVIQDERGLPFYDTTPLLPRVKYFNLPAGNYTVVKGWFCETLLPRIYPLTVLPAPERVLMDPSDFEIEFDVNPHKCSIFWDEKVIVFDKSFIDKTTPEICFVLFHEYGHQMFETEKYADLFAANLMKQKGFNPSQIVSGHNLSLSDAQQYRKDFVIEKLINEL